MHYINIKEARKHNLKNIDISIPHNQIIAFTGVSGSGKSTLAYDIIYSEASARYLDAISDEITNELNETCVDKIDGILPAIACKQVSSFNNNICSTVATVTEIGSFLRILFAELGDRVCQKCAGKCKSSTSICPHCGENLKVLSAPMFSYNTQTGMCKRCQGTGITHDFSINLIVPEPDKPIQSQPWGRDATTIFKMFLFFLNHWLKHTTMIIILLFQSFQKNIRILYCTELVESKLSIMIRRKGPFYLMYKWDYSTVKQSL